MTSSRPPWSLDGRTAVVTGTSSGVGRAIATVLAHAGAGVACLDLRPTPREGGFDEHPDRPTHDLIRSTGGEAFFHAADVASYASMHDAFTTVRARYRTIDIVVNNAGTAAWAPIHEESEADYDRVMDVNAKGAWIGCKLACATFLEQGTGGRIVNIASVGGYVGLPVEPAYCASKGAVVNLTRQVALDYGPRRVACNVVCPGPLQTALTRRFVDDERDRAALQATTPWPRLGTALDIANAVHFLCSDAAEWITGAVVPVDGGYSAH